MKKIIQFARCALHRLDFLSPLVDLLLRLWLANVFFKSGLTKINNWDATLSLFQNEYHVPFLSPELAAFMGAATELSIPVLLVLGLATRFASIALFVFNGVAVISYPDLSPAGLDAHIYWGMLLLVLSVHGPGKISIDQWLNKRCGSRGCSS